MRVRVVTTAFAAMALIAGSFITVSAQEPKLPLRIKSWAINMGNTATGANAIVDIVINRWSTEKELAGLRTTFFEKGPHKLLDAVFDSKPVGYLKPPNAIGYDLRASRYVRNPDGTQQVILLTDRPMSFREQANQPRSVDYPFTLIEMHTTKDGKGEGKMSYATKISFNKKTNSVELENYGTEPVRLTNLEIEK